MASTHASQRRLKFAIEFAAIGQQEIEGWLSYFEAMDVNELGAARARRPVTRGHRTSMRMLRAGVLQRSLRLPRLPRQQVHARGLPITGRALGRQPHGFRRDGEMYRAVLHARARRPTSVPSFDATRGHLTSMSVVSFSSLSAFRARSRLDTYHTQVRQGRVVALRLPDF